MIKNYFKIAARNLWKNKGITLIQLLGLSAGIAVCLLIMMVLKYEYSFDHHNSKAKNVYRIVTDFTRDNNAKNSITTPYPLPLALRTEFPELKVSAVHLTENTFVQTPDKTLFRENNVFFFEAQIVDILDVPVTEGDARKALANPGNVILTVTAAKKYFGTSEAIGKILRLENKLDLYVSAIMNDWPQTSHIRPNMIVSYSSFTKDYQGLPVDQWGMNIAGRTYFLAPDNFDSASFTKKLPAFVNKYFSKEDAPSIKLGVSPLSGFHLDQKYKGDGETAAVSPTYLNIFIWIAFLILLIAVINYVNLSTARSGLRSREIGVRKVVGASRQQVMQQFLTESILFTLIAGMVAVIIAALVLPWLNQVFEKSIPFYFSVLHLSYYTVSLLVLGLLAGIYPALILAGLKPLSLVRAGSFPGNSKHKHWVRQSLVAVQFACAIAFVFGSLVIAMQIYYVQHKDPGFSVNNLVNVSLPEAKHLEELRRDWQSIPGVEEVTFNLGAPVSENNFGTSLILDKALNNKIEIMVKPVDHLYPKTYGLTLIAGRWLTKEDEKYADMKLPEEELRYNFVINEKLAKSLGFNDAQQALGKKYEIGVNDIIGHIVGVVKDFHYKSLHDPIEPLLMMNFPFFNQSAGIKFSMKENPGMIEAIKKVYSNYFSNVLFEYEYMDQAMDKFYKNDKQAFQLLMFITILAVLLAALGLVGLSVFVIQRRTREIGIRKVLGSTVQAIVRKLSWEFIQPVLIACFVAFPLGWWAMNKWLDNFAYRISISWWMLLLTGVAAIIIALFTVGLQSLKAAFSNPVKSLRTE